jgi:hypothetical protein
MCNTHLALVLAREEKAPPMGMCTIASSALKGEVVMRDGCKGRSTELALVGARLRSFTGVEGTAPDDIAGWLTAEGVVRSASTGVIAFWMASIMCLRTDSARIVD